MDNIQAKWHTSISEIPKYFWEKNIKRPMIPFFEWNWLLALEQSHSVHSSTGWQSFHLALWKDNSPIAVAPLYLKSHSFGEFVYDQTFAKLSMELGIEYYPKFVGMSPFSPIEGYRFLIDESFDDKYITRLMMKIIDKFSIENGISSCNFLYADEDWLRFADQEKWSVWINQKSMWFAKGENSFEDYLDRFNSNQRKNIKKERRSIQENGIKIQAIYGQEIKIDLMKKIYYFYEMHCRKWGDWGSKYLTEDFFIELTNDYLLNKLLLFIATRDDSNEPIAMSFCIKNSETIWGRYWGALEEIKNLHFELCYYSPIAWALENGIKFFDPGAGGSHKLRRGFIAKPHTSLHRWYNRKMEEIIPPWLTQVNNLMIQEIEAINNHLPLKKSNSKLPLESFRDDISQT